MELSVELINEYIEALLREVQSLTKDKIFLNAQLEYSKKQLELNSQINVKLQEHNEELLTEIKGIKSRKKNDNV